MAVYLLNYDLINESGKFDYQPLWNELKRLGAYRVLYSAWLISLNNTPNEVVNHFRKFTDGDDRVMASRLRPNEYYCVNAISGTNAWLQENPPI